jgi:hypothetical protein
MTILTENSPIDVNVESAPLTPVIYDGAKHYRGMIAGKSRIFKFLSSANLSQENPWEFVTYDKYVVPIVIIGDDSDHNEFDHIRQTYGVDKFHLETSTIEEVDFASVFSTGEILGQSSDDDGIPMQMYFTNVTLRVR